MDSEERHKWSTDERAILQQLDLLLRETAIKDALNSLVARMRSRVSGNGQKIMDRESVPLAVYGDKLPSGIRASWVYLIGTPAVTGAERHPNSHQRTMSYTGSGFFEVSDSPDFEDGEGASNLLTSDFDAPMETRWISIPAGTWHQAVVDEGEWVVLSFHTAAENEIIEERPS